MRERGPLESQTPRWRRFSGLMARRSLLDRVNPGSVHRMAGELGPDVAASLYEPIVRWLSPLDLSSLALVAIISGR